MSIGEERKILSLMTDPDEVSRIWDAGLRPEVFEDPICRFAFAFSIEYWLQAQMLRSPTRDVLEAEFPELSLPRSVEETTDWLVSRLQRRHATNRVQELIRQAASSMNSQDPRETLDRLWQSAYAASQAHAPRHSRVDVTETVQQRQNRYDAEAAQRAQTGIGLGLDQLDLHTRGLLPGELAAVAAYTKTGKSWLLAKAFVSALESGRSPLFFSLEMDVPEITDRIDALWSGASYQKLSQRILNPAELASLRESQARMAELQSVTPAWVERPDRGERTVKHMVSRARQLGADIIIIDQLSFIDAERQYSGDSALRMKHGDLVFELKDEISNGHSGKIPCLLAVQLNRQAASAGNGARGELYHFANSSMVEQTVDLALGLWRNTEMRANNAMGLDIIGSRRCDTRSWTLAWHLTSRTEISIREEFLETQGGP